MKNRNNGEEELKGHEEYLKSFFVPREGHSSLLGPSSFPPNWKFSDYHISPSPPHIIPTLTNSPTVLTQYNFQIYPVHVDWSCFRGVRALLMISSLVDHEGQKNTIPPFWFKHKKILLNASQYTELDVLVPTPIGDFNTTYEDFSLATADLFQRTLDTEESKALILFAIRGLRTVLAIALAGRVDFENIPTEKDGARHEGRAHISQKVSYLYHHKIILDVLRFLPRLDLLETRYLIQKPLTSLEFSASSNDTLSRIARKIGNLEIRDDSTISLEASLTDKTQKIKPAQSITPFQTNNLPPSRIIHIFQKNLNHQ